MNYISLGFLNLLRSWMLFIIKGAKTKVPWSLIPLKEWVMHMIDFPHHWQLWARPCQLLRRAKRLSSWVPLPLLEENKNPSHPVYFCVLKNFNFFFNLLIAFYFHWNALVRKLSKNKPSHCMSEIHSKGLNILLVEASIWEMGNNSLFFQLRIFRPTVSVSLCLGWIFLM